MRGLFILEHGGPSLTQPVALQTWYRVHISLHIQSLQVLHRKLCAFLFQDSAANFRIELAGKPNAVHHGIALLLARRLAHAGEPISQDEGLHIIDGVRKANLHTVRHVSHVFPRFEPVLCYTLLVQ